MERGSETEGKGVKEREVGREEKGQKEREKEAGERSGENVHQRGCLLPLCCVRHWPISVTSIFKDIR